ncbi:DUF2793 domain-containing protein [Pontixanthobacter sp.]|uniref:DUF2793 domain-containing protein n=1 Tax=Pontixanthobacter sp. TaxID=2792078 RepID=UPI003C7A390F
MTDSIAFTSTSARFGLPFLIAGQAQKEFTVNQATAMTDALMHASVIAERADPPAAPAEGDSYIIAANAGSVWAGKTGYLASYQGGVWIMVAPIIGMRVFDQSSRQMIHFDGIWVRPVTPVMPVTGVTQDTELRQAFTDLIERLKEAKILTAT